MSLFRYFKKWAFLLCCLTQKIAVVVCIMTLQRFSNVTLPNTLVNVVSSDHRVYSNNDSTSDSTSHVIACDDFTRSRNLVIGLLCRYNNRRYYCWTEKLMLHRNWGLQTKLAIRYVCIHAYIIM